MVSWRRTGPARAPTRPTHSSVLCGLATWGCGPAQHFNKNARWPVSRVLSSLLRRMGDHSSRRRIAPPLKRPTRAAGRNRPMCRPYSVLHPVGFAVPAALPKPRCALAAPFRPCRPESRRSVFCGTFPEPLARFPWQRARRALPGTVIPWSPDFPRLPKGAAAAQPPGVPSDSAIADAAARGTAAWPGTRRRRCRRSGRGGSGAGRR